MFHTAANYLRERRDGALRHATLAGGAYFAVGYVRARFKELRDAQLLQKFAEDSIRRRFGQCQQNASFSIMALLPNLGHNVLEGMNIEALTAELQELAQISKQEKVSQVSLPPRPSSPAISAQEPISSDSDIRSENGSVSVVSYPEHDGDVASPDLEASTTSWVENMSPNPGSQASHSPDPSSSHGHDREASYDSSPKSNAPTDLSESFISSSSVSYGDLAAGLQGGPSQPTMPIFTRSKGEIWREVKILTFTRTLTTVYSMTLLSLLIHTQRNILGRMNYVQSVMSLAQDERNREIRRDAYSLTNLIFGTDIDANYDPQDIYSFPSVGEETETKYLTLSWWLLHVGWKDVGERVRRAVEEVFDEVSLKAKTSANDLRRYLYDVRRRVEYEITFEGKERRISFASTVLPPTPETIRHTLVQGGIPFRQALTRDDIFDTLVSETRAHIASGSFDRVLEVCLDKATEILFHQVEKSIFTDDSSQEWEDPNSAVGLTQEPRVRLAAMLPALGSWCQETFEGLPNELIDGVGAVREVSAYSAIVYTNYDDRLQ